MTIKFKTEEDRHKALAHASENIPEVDAIPDGVDVDDFIEKNAKKLEEIMEAPIDTEVPEWAPPTEDKKPDSQPQAAPPAPEPPPTKEPEVGSFEIDTLKRSSQKMQAEYEERLKKTNEELENYKKEMEEKLAALKPKEEEKPVLDPDVNRLIQEKSLELKNAVSDLEQVDDYTSEDFLKLTKKQSKLQYELSRLETKKNEALLTDSQNKLKAMREAAESQNKKWEEDQKRRKEEEEVNKKREEAEKVANAAITRIEQFRDTVPELKDGRSYVEMEKDYLDFARKVAAIYYDILPEDVTGEQMDTAYTKYMSKVPALVEKVQANKFEPPKDVDKFLVLNDVNNIYAGTEFDYTTGTWKPVVNEHGVQVGSASMKQAYNYYLEKTGKTAQDLLTRERESVKNFQGAMQKRQGPVELSQEMQGGSSEKLTQEAAIRLVNETNEDDIARIRDKGAEANEIEKMILAKFNEATKLVYGEVF